MSNALKSVRPYFLFLFLGLASCGPSDSDTQVVQPWELQPPYFQSYDEKTDAATKSVKLNRLEAWGSELELYLTDDLVIEEAATLSGAVLTGRTVCKLGDEEFTSDFSTGLKKQNPLYTLMPKEILFLSLHQLKQLACTSQITARKSNGSTHAFGEALQFKILGENRELLQKLENAYEPFEKSYFENAHLFDFQKSRSIFLDPLPVGERYRLVCRKFEQENSQARSLHEIIMSAHLGNLERRPDDFCRLFVLNANGVVKTSSLFQLRFFDLKNYVESIKDESRIAYNNFGNGSKASHHSGFRGLELNNRTKYPIYLRAKLLNCSFVGGDKRGNVTSSGRSAVGVLGPANPLERSHLIFRDNHEYHEVDLQPGQQLTLIYFFLHPVWLKYYWIDCNGLIPTVEIYEKDEQGMIRSLTEIPMLPSSVFQWYNG